MGQLFDDVVKECPDKICFYFEAEKWTFSQVLDFEQYFILRMLRNYAHIQNTSRFKNILIKFKHTFWKRDFKKVTASL